MDMEKTIYKNNFFTDIKSPREPKIVGYRYEDEWYSTKEDDNYYRFRPIYEVDIPKHKRHIVKVFYKEIGFRSSDDWMNLDTEKTGLFIQHMLKNGRRFNLTTKKELIDYIKEVVKGR